MVGWCVGVREQFSGAGFAGGRGEEERFVSSRRATVRARDRDGESWWREPLGVRIGQVRGTWEQVGRRLGGWHVGPCDLAEE